MVAGGPGQRFAGRLGLLHILATILEREAPADVLGSDDGQFAARSNSELGERVGDMRLDGPS
jgi:hypothetical protein